MRHLYFTCLLVIYSIVAVMNMSIIPLAYAQEYAFWGLFSPKQQQEFPQSLEIFREVFDKIKEQYVMELDDEKVLQGAVEGMVSALDPHCEFYTPKEYRELKMMTSGEFVGLGIEVSMENEALKVLTLFEDSPAKSSGVKINDLIIAIENQSVRGMKLYEAVDKLRGSANSKVNITILRNSTGETIPMEITRQPIFLIPVKSKMINDIIYLKISNFNEKVSTKAKQAVKELIKDHPNFKGMVLDLRSNPGGLLDQACEVADLFLEKGEIVTMKSRQPKDSAIFKASHGDIITGAPLVVLINSGTASAPEIVAGALQDNKRAMIIGEKSFGKGSVQTIFALSSGAAIKLTTARYYSPSGRAIQVEGVVPDIVVENAIVQPIMSNDWLFKSEESLKGHLPSDIKSDHLENESWPKQHAKPLDAKEDFQLLRALDLVQGMALYNNKKDKNAK